MSHSPKNENSKNTIENNPDRKFQNGKCPYDNIKPWNSISKYNQNSMQESYYNGNDWRYPHINFPQNLPANYSSATYYFNNNPYQCFPSYVYNPYSNDMNYVYYPVRQLQHYNNYWRGSNSNRYNSHNNNNRNFRKHRAGKQYVYNVKNDFYFNDEGEYIDDNIDDMQEMKEIETLDEEIPKEHYNYRDYCNSPSNDELCESTSMLLDRVTERAKGYLNLYSHNIHDNIRP